MELFYQPFVELVHFQPVNPGKDLQLWELVTLGYLFILFIVSAAHCIVSGFEDKIRTRSYLHFLIFINFCIFLFIFLQPAHCMDLLSLLLIGVSILVGHLFVLTNSKAANLFFIGSILFQCMDAFINFLIEWGYLGMFLSAVLAGSVVPFSSEAVLAALVLPSTGLSPVICLLSASAGNLLGSLTCYAMGRMGRMDWLEKYFHMKREKVERMQAYLNGRSGFMAFFAFLPIIGSVIAVALGFLRSNIWVVSISMLAGKMLRYILVILAARGLIDLMV